MFRRLTSKATQKEREAREAKRKLALNALDTLSATAIQEIAREAIKVRANAG